VNQIKGMVAAGHPATAKAGAEILRCGGNAVDAAVAAVCTAFIAEPALTAAGGGGFLLLRQPNGKTRLYDGFARMPGRNINTIKADFRAIPVDFGDMVQTFHIGRASVATPSLMAMLFKAHQESGRIPIREVLQPAMTAARDGIRLNPLQASFIRLLSPILSDTPECRTLHAPAGKLLAEGELFRNPDLANILELLSIEGIKEMYRGDVAQSIGKACQPGGLLSAADLSRLQVDIRAPLALQAFGGEFLTNPPPSSGGCLIAFSLHLFEEMMRRLPDTPLPILMAEAMHATSLARGEDFDELVHRPDMESAFLSPARWRKGMQEAVRRLESGAGSHTPAESGNRHGSTTHISAIDKEGQAVSLTTSNGEGSGIVVPGTGIHLNNMLGEQDINPMGFHRLPGGKTLSSMMAPSIFVRYGRPELVLGSGGSNRLRGAILQVLCNHIIAENAIEAAVQAPRLHNEGNVLDVEPDGLSHGERHQLEKMGWEIRDWREASVYFGGVHALCMHDGSLCGAGDPRRGGSVACA